MLVRSLDLVDEPEFFVDEIRFIVYGVVENRY